MTDTPSATLAALRELERETDFVAYGKGGARVTMPELAAYLEGRGVGVQQEGERPSAEALAQRFHETYERLAPQYGYKTREESAKPWADVPPQNHALMVAVCAEILRGARLPEEGAPREPCRNGRYVAIRGSRIVMEADDMGNLLERFFEAYSHKQGTPPGVNTFFGWLCHEAPAGVGAGSPAEPKEGTP